MDEAVIKYYKTLIKSGFKHMGLIENPSLVLKDESGERIRICSSVGSYIRLQFIINNNVITGIKYLCTCNPASHVAIEILCTLIEGKTLDEAAATTVDSFFQVLGSKSEELRPKAKSLIELLKIGIGQFQHNTKIIL